jgi:hypothetical protein
MGRAGTAAFCASTSMTRLHTFLAATILAGAADAAFAQDLRRGLVRIEAGDARIHGTISHGNGAHVALRVARVWQDDHIRLEGSFIHGTADDGFTGADVGIELRGTPSRSRVVPYAAVALGGIHDRLGAAPMARLSVGIDLRLNADRLLRIGLLRSTHGKGSSGPNAFVVGFTQRFGAS